VRYGNDSTVEKEEDHDAYKHGKSRAPLPLEQPADPVASICPRGWIAARLPRHQSLSTGLHRLRGVRQREWSHYGTTVLRADRDLHHNHEHIQRNLP